MSGDGSTLIYATYLGGTGYEVGSEIAVDDAGHAYVVGWTTSTDNSFPVVGAFQSTYGGGSYDVFVSKLGAQGDTLEYSTYFGGSGSDYVSGIAVDVTQAFHIAGNTLSDTDFPLAGAFQSVYGGSADGYVAKFTPLGDALEYSTYLGGDCWDSISGIEIGSGGHAYVAGKTCSHDFPLLNAIQPTLEGVDFGLGINDGFVTKFLTDGSNVVFSTYLGGAIGGAIDIVVDATDHAYVTGFAQFDLTLL